MGSAVLRGVYAGGALGRGGDKPSQEAEGPEVTVTNLKQGESLWKRKTPGATQPIEVKGAEQTCSCDWAPVR